MFGFVCRKMGLFLALLHREKVFCQFSASHADFYLFYFIRLFSGKLRCFHDYVCQNSLFLFFSYLNWAFKVRKPTKTLFRLKPSETKSDSLQTG